MRISDWSSDVYSSDLALTLVNLLRPGDGIDPEFARTMLASAGDGAKAIVSTSREAPTGLDALLNIVPTNIIGAAGSNDILAVTFFALLFGIGLVMVDTPETRTDRTSVVWGKRVSVRVDIGGGRSIK